MGTNRTQSLSEQSADSRPRQKQYCTTIVASTWTNIESRRKSPIELSVVWWSDGNLEQKTNGGKKSCINMVTKQWKKRGAARSIITHSLWLSSSTHPHSPKSFSNQRHSRKMSNFFVPSPQKLLVTSDLIFLNSPNKQHAYSKK